MVITRVFTTDVLYIYVYIYVYHLFVAMLHRTVEEYGKGDRQTQNVQKKEQIKWKESEKSVQDHQDIAICIMIFQGI